MIERKMFLPDDDNPQGLYPLNVRQPVENQDGQELDEQTNWHGDGDGTVGVD